MEFDLLLNWQGVSFPRGVPPTERKKLVSFFRASARRFTLDTTNELRPREQTRPHLVPLKSGEVVLRVPALRGPIAEHFQEGCSEPTRRGLQYTLPQLPDHNVGLFHTTEQGERLLVGIVSPRRSALHRFFHS